MTNEKNNENKTADLELGNLLFNESNKNQTFECPDYVVALLEKINNELSRVYWNQHQEEYCSPFSNSGNNYKGECFEVNAYAWDTEDDDIQNYNFKYKDIEISWYKHLGRDTTINREIKPEEAIEMFDTILKEIYQTEEKNITITDRWDR